MSFVLLKDDEQIPEKIRLALPENCSYCNSPLMVWHNETGRATGLRCSNNTCPSMIASRIEFILDLLKIKGYGFATCLSLVNRHSITVPIEILRILNVKPVVDVGTYLRLHCIEGIDQEWVQMSERADVYTLDELYGKYPTHEMLLKYKDLFYQYADLVEFTKRPHNSENLVHVLTIMITGTPIGFPTKEAFVAACNQVCAGYVKVIHQATPRQSGVDFLIREEGSTTRGKVSVALKAGIPIVTSEQFLRIILELMKRIKDGDVK